MHAGNLQILPLSLSRGLNTNLLLSNKMVATSTYDQESEHQFKVTQHLILVFFGHHMYFQSFKLFSIGFNALLACFFYSLKGILFCHVCGCYGSYSFMNCYQGMEMWFVNFWKTIDPFKVVL